MEILIKGSLGKIDLILKLGKILFTFFCVKHIFCGGFAYEIGQLTDRDILGSEEITSDFN